MLIPLRPLGVAIAGAGLILLGGAIWNLLADSQARNEMQPTDFSAIPATVKFDAPVLALSDIAGRSHALAEYHGQVVLVNLWATWCPPCAAEMPNLQRYFRRHQAEHFIVVAINDGDPLVQVRSFVDAHDLTFSIWMDPTYQATVHAFKTTDLPSSYVIDRLGKVRLMWLGAISEANLERFVTPLIKE